MKRRKRRKVSRGFRTTIKRGQRIPMIVKHKTGETIMAVGIDWDGKHYFDIPANVELVIPERRPS
jgi:hypothetical protein